MSPKEVTVSSATFSAETFDGIKVVPQARQDQLFFHMHTPSLMAHVVL